MVQTVETDRRHSSPTCLKEALVGEDTLLRTVASTMFGQYHVVGANIRSADRHLEGLVVRVGFAVHQSPGSNARAQPFRNCRYAVPGCTDSNVWNGNAARPMEIPRLVARIQSSACLRTRWRPGVFAGAEFSPSQFHDQGRGWTYMYDEGPGQSLFSARGEAVGGPTPGQVLRDVSVEVAPMRTATLDLISTAKAVTS
ncbi:hypothetical protein S7711_10939 [Stachybotrys chartarum IBT 7711]|uniref:Uncharacterized protein n=1 Tax=Stachybotrys chartarum (strain CBS 109288 / IBT 7711) TaxID=1280523 RepID=A0A084B9A1_STACB|nr:hypothetical protein S7711_10939 [Stachybotrys chartarum IBT 7711]